MKNIKLFEEFFYSEGESMENVLKVGEKYRIVYPSHEEAEFDNESDEVIVLSKNSRGFNVKNLKDGKSFEISYETLSECEIEKIVR